jgi:hypothetical protein
MLTSNGIKRRLRGAKNIGPVKQGEQVISHFVSLKGVQKNLFRTH